MEQNRFEECSEDFCECILSMNREREDRIRSNSLAHCSIKEPLTGTEEEEEERDSKLNEIESSTIPIWSNVIG